MNTNVEKAIETNYLEAFIREKNNSISSNFACFPQGYG